jgi:thioredoxin reductase (NADPH)
MVSVRGKRKDMVRILRSQARRAAFRGQYDQPMSVRDVIVVGAGPSGLATAIALKQLGLDYLVIEKGTLVESIRRFPVNMVFFTTPELMEVGGIPLTTPYDKPTRLEALLYYRKVTDIFDLQVSLRDEVLHIEQDDEAGERIFLLDTRSHLGVRRVRKARVVVLAMGYYDRPNLLNVTGEDLPHVRHYFDEPHRRARDPAAPRTGARRLGEVLGQARH